MKLKKLQIFLSLLIAVFWSSSVNATSNRGGRDYLRRLAQDSDNSSASDEEGPANEEAQKARQSLLQSLTKRAGESTQDFRQRLALEDQSLLKRALRPQFPDFKSFNVDQMSFRIRARSVESIKKHVLFIYRTFEDLHFSISVKSPRKQREREVIELSPIDTAQLNRWKTNGLLSEDSFLQLMDGRDVFGSDLSPFRFFIPNLMRSEGYGLVGLGFSSARSVLQMRVFAKSLESISTYLNNIYSKLSFDDIDLDTCTTHGPYLNNSPLKT